MQGWHYYVIIAASADLMRGAGRGESGHIVSRSAPHCLVSLLGQCGHYDFYLSSYPLIFLVPCDNTTHNLHHQIASDRGCGFIIIMHFLDPIGSLDFTLLVIGW